MENWIGGVVVVEMVAGTGMLMDLVGGWSRRRCSLHLFTCCHSSAAARPHRLWAAGLVGGLAALMEWWGNTCVGRLHGLVPVRWRSVVRAWTVGGCGRFKMVMEELDAGSGTEVSAQLYCLLTGGRREGKGVAFCGGRWEGKAVASCRGLSSLMPFFYAIR